MLNNWFEDEEYWIELAPFFFDENRMSSTKQEVEQIVKLMNLKRGSEILDLCCGIGRHSLEFVKSGFKVTGVDRCDYYLDKFRQQAKSENLPVEIVKSDMRDYCFENSFNAAIMMFTSLGYFKDRSDDIKVIRNIYKSLKNGGTVLIDLMGRELLSQIYMPRDWRELEGRFLLEEREPSSDWSVLKNRWIVFRDGIKFEYKFQLNIYSGPEMIEILKDCGFSEVKIFGDLLGSPYDVDANRLIVVGHK